MEKLKSIISVLKYVLFIVLSLLLVLVIRLFLCNFYRVPSDSMMPSILPGDFILADKWTYGARIFTSLKFDRNSDLPMIHVPGYRKIRRNDVLVFNFPYRYGWDTVRMNLDKIFVKRCIGLPGDTVSVIDGLFHISGSRDTLDFWRIPAARTTIRLTPRNFKLYRKQIVYETNAVIHVADSFVYFNDTVKYDYTFRSNWYFVAGDNAMNSKDSRYLGLIPEAYIIGKASIIISSKDMNTGKRRWNRILKKIK